MADVFGGIRPVDDGGQQIRIPRAPRASEPKPTPDKPLDGMTTKTEIQRAFASIFNVGLKFLRDEERYTPSDFNEEADGLIELANQHAPIRIGLRLLMPIAAAAAMIEKVQAAVERLRARRQREQPPAVDVPLEPPVPVAVNGTGLTAEQISKRPFGR